jgi:hypothetical protein
MRDNPTGIYVGSGDEFYVMVEDTKGQNLSLVIQNLDLGWGSNKTLPLSKGENVLTAPQAGLLYVMNQTNDAIPLILETDAQKAAAAAKTVKMHFINGKVQGYYRKGVTTLPEWREMIEAAPYREIDIVGDYTHLTWTASSFKALPNNIETMVKYWDELALLQQEFMGLVKYGKVFSNRQYMMHINSGSPNATMYRTCYLTSYSEIFTTPSGFLNRLWVLGHELGHINQTHGIKWAGTTEVTNNLLAAYVQRKILLSRNPNYTPRFMNPYGAAETTWDGVKYPDDYQAGIAAIVVGQNPLVLENDPNHFYMKAIPFWQLYLYLVEVLGKNDFWPDMHEFYRTIQPNASSLPHGEQQLLFAEKACEIANLDLTEFFEKWGFLRLIDKTLNDYGSKTITITQEQLDEVKSRIAAKGYPAPKHSADRIIEIRESNLDSYR